MLPEIYDPSQPQASVGIGLHFAAGGLILVLGGMQLIDSIRSNYPRVHHWTGRLYIFLSLVAAIGGLSFIAIKGTVGGLVMDIGFGLYGILMFVAAVHGWFDHIMAFFFYIPNLLIVELMIRSRSQASSKRLRTTASMTMIGACLLLVVATWGFARVAWLPAIVDFLTS